MTYSANPPQPPATPPIYQGPENPQAYFKIPFFNFEINKANYLKVILVALGFLVGITLSIYLGLSLFTPKTPINYQTSVSPTPATLPSATLKGNIHFEGYAPADSYVAISAREVGKTNFQDVVSGLVPGQNNTWTWTDANPGTNYDIKALLKVKGKTIDQSAIQQVSAPANGVVLILISEQNPPQPATTTISGDFHLSGYIPNGSSVQILSRPTGKGNFSPVASNLIPQSNQPWSWNNAVSSNAYDMTAQLLGASGNIISTSTTNTVTAPSTGVSFDINSTAQPPTQIVSGISGTITINGNIPANSYITLGTRGSTQTTAFNQVVNGLTAASGVSWNWNNAASGQQYDVQAYLWSNNKPYASSNILTVAAPSANNELTINTQQTLSTPSTNTINVSCGGQQNNNYQVTVNYNTDANLQNVQKYQIVVTLASQGTQVINTTVSPGNPSTSQSITTGFLFIKGATYFAQYSYSLDGVTFSALSPSIQFSCNQ